MEKRVLSALAALLCVLALAGCKTIVAANAEIDLDSVAKAQKIEVCDADGAVLRTLEGGEEIDAFVAGMDIGRWKLGVLPEGTEYGGSFVLYQQETVTALFGAGGTEVNKICTFRYCKDQPYLVVEAGVAGITFVFEVPREVTEHLRSQLEA